MGKYKSKQTQYFDWKISSSGEKPNLTKNVKKLEQTRLWLTHCVLKENLVTFREPFSFLKQSFFCHWKPIKNAIYYLQEFSLEFLLKLIPMFFNIKPVLIQ